MPIAAPSRPEAAYLLERFVDHIARETGLGPDEIRVRPSASQIPWKTALGDTYDSGVSRPSCARPWTRPTGTSRPVAPPPRPGGQVAWHRHGDLCREMRRRRRHAETAVAKFNDDASLTLFGNQTSGRGHETAIRQIASARLGIDAERIAIVQGDSDVTPGA